MGWTWHATKAFCRTCNSGTGSRRAQPLAKADGNGLTFTLSTAGVAGWILRYRHGGRRRELTIGRYPDISLADARGIATIKRAEIMQGRNPAADKQKAKATAAKDWTVRELVKDYRAKKLVSLAHSTQVSYGRHLKRVEKKLGALTVREIEASDVVALRRCGRQMGSRTHCELGAVQSIDSLAGGACELVFEHRFQSRRREEGSEQRRVVNRNESRRRRCRNRRQGGRNGLAMGGCVIHGSPTKFFRICSRRSESEHHTHWPTALMRLVRRPPLVDKRRRLSARQLAIPHEQVNGDAAPLCSMISRPRLLSGVVAFWLCQ